MYSRIASVVAVASALDCFTQSPPAAGEAQPSPNLSGRWRLDPAKSENPRDKVQEARETEQPPTGTHDGAGRRHGPGGRGGGARGPGQPSESRPGGGRETRPDVDELLAAPSDVAITHTDSVVTILETDGRVRLLQLDAQPHTSEGGAAQVTSRWSGDQLVVETVRSGTPKLTETFTLDRDRTQLTVEMRLEGRLAVRVRRLYERQLDDRPEPPSRERNR